MKKLFKQDPKVAQVEKFNAQLEKFKTKPANAIVLAYFLNEVLFDSFEMQEGLHKPIGDLVANVCGKLSREFQNTVYIDFPLSYNNQSPTWMQANKAGNLRRWIDWWREYSDSFDKDDKLESGQFKAWVQLIRTLNGE